jgi:putative nucleotidyltransferase with HDIG domain
MSRFSTDKQHIILKGIRELPSLPEIVNKIIQKLSLPNTPASEIARLIGYDLGLTSKVLRMVNSAAYGLQRQISSIQHGIMILGFNTVRGLVLSASIFKLIEEQGEAGDGQAWDYKEFWTHSMLTGICTRRIAEMLYLPDREDAFSAGMLHDIGVMILNVYFKKEYEDVFRYAREKNLTPYGKAFLNLEQEMLGTTHVAVGSIMAAKWKLPTTLAEVIQYHHSPESATLCQPLVYAAALANEIVHHPNLFSDVMLEPKDLSADLLVRLGIDSTMLEQLVEQLREEAHSTDELFAAIE